MEKRHQPSFHSDKILGQLYDKVDSVDFIPRWEQPFDRRILQAYRLDDNTLKAARQVKSEYDMAMRRIMAQQEINTEFEVWSTFVLSKPRVGSDYKVQEAMAVISEGLKEQFRATSIKRAGCIDGKDFSKLGPFVAAMYKVTKEELDIALAECRMTKIVAGRPQPKRKMEQKSMPLISFPWLFEKELGRIATGMEAEDDLLGLGLLSSNLKKDGQARKRQGGGIEDLEDFIQQEDGVIVHRGEELDLFRPDVESEDLSGESDFEEARSSIIEDGSHVVGDSGEAISNMVFPMKATSVDLLSDTGVEDVVPRTQMDGFLDPREMARQAYSSGSQHPYSQRIVSVAGSKPAAMTTTNFVSPSIADLSPLYTPVFERSGPEAEEELFEAEEEEVHLDVGESSLEKLARMMDS